MPKKKKKRERDCTMNGSDITYFCSTLEKPKF